MGYHSITSRNSINDYYDISYTFFRERASRPKIEIYPARDADKIGFQVVVRGNGIRRPSVSCNDTQFQFERRDHDAELEFLQVNTPYFVYPFAINQDESVGAYIIQRTSRHIAPNQPNNDTSVQASIRITGEGFDIEKNCNLTTNLSVLRLRRHNSNELIPTKSVIISLVEQKEPPLSHRSWASLRPKIFRIRRSL